MINREGHAVGLHLIEKLEATEDGAAITYEGGTTFFLDNDELDGFVPEVGDPLLITTRNWSNVLGVVINNHVIRHKTEKKWLEEHEQWRKNWRLEKLERYLKEGDALKARANSLHPTLKARMNRFAEESGEDFWIDDASYEMYALEGANALINKTKELDLEGDEAVEWVSNWSDLNSKKHDYDYKKQMELVPDFGDGHSGNTAGAAVGLAKIILGGGTV